MHVGDVHVLTLFHVIHISEPAFDPSVANCDFEEGLCQYYQEQTGGSVWNRVSVKPNVYRFGDHTTGTGAKVRLFFSSNHQICDKKMCTSLISNALWLKPYF